MKIGKTEINLEKVNFILNIISFIAGMLFYVKMGIMLDTKSTQQNNKPLHDTVIVHDSVYPTPLLLNPKHPAPS